MAKNEISPLLIIGVLIFVALAFYFSRGAPTFSSTGLTSSSSCQDSDNGIDIFMKGTINGGLSETGQVIATPQYDECQSATQLIEMYCDDNGYRKAMLITCPDGQSCTDGICAGGVPGGAQ